MLRLLKALPLTLAIAAVSIVATSCGSNNGTKARFVNAIENTLQYGGALDVEVNGTQQFSNVTFASPGSTYIPIPSGNVTIEGFESPGVTTPVFTDSTTLSSGTEYTEVATGFAIGTGGQVALLSLSDDNSAPEHGTLNFRVINAAYNASSSPNGSVDIWIEPTPYNFSLSQPATIRDLAYQSASGYVNVSYNPDAEGFTVFVNTVGLGAEVGTPLILPYAISVNGSLSSASVCTLVLVDSPNSNSMSTPILLDDSNCS